MKKILLSTLLMLLFSTALFAQRGEMSGSIQIDAQHQNEIFIEIPSLNLAESVRGGFLILNLLPGSYQIVISIGHGYQNSGGHGGNQSHYQNNQTIRQTVTVYPQKKTIVEIDRHNRLKVTTVFDANSIFLNPVGQNPGQGYGQGQGHNHGHGHSSKPHGVPRMEPVPNPVFDKQMQELEKKSFSSDKIAFVETLVAVNNYYTSNQLGRMMKLFSNDSDKLKCARIVIPYVVDPQNLVLQTDIFSFSSSQNSFMEMIRELGE